MFSGIYWGMGRRRSNEDTLALELVRTEKGLSALAVVCDGIGTLDHGEIVSGYVTECLVKWFYGVGMHMSGASRAAIRRSLSRCTYDCHLELKARSAKADLRWGCTMTAVCLWNSRYACAHLGDSEAVLLAPGGIRRVTEPHRNESGQLVKCVGSMGYFPPDVRFGRLGKGRGMLVASDGFMEKLTDEEVGEMLRIRGEMSDEAIERRLAAMGAETERRGGSDNRSAVCIFR